jgi:hypothetical protein
MWIDSSPCILFARARFGTSDQDSVEPPDDAGACEIALQIIRDLKKQRKRAERLGRRLTGIATVRVDLPKAGHGVPAAAIGLVFRFKGGMCRRIA